MKFVNYAHRGASEYLPENTLISFCTGLFMGANGIETDVRLTKDGVAVLFHDDSLLRVTGTEGRPEDFTYAQLQQLRVSKNGYWDRILSFEDFLRHFAYRDLTFAIELKGPGAEAETARLLRQYGMAEKTIVTSFKKDYLANFRALAPEFEIGLLTSDYSQETLDWLRNIGAQEICPKAEHLTAQRVARWHALGLRVRAWGVYDEALMDLALRCGVDGMTVNFPDKLTARLNQAENF